MNFRTEMSKIIKNEKYKVCFYFGCIGIIS